VWSKHFPLKTISEIFATFFLIFLGFLIFVEVFAVLAQFFVCLYFPQQNSAFSVVYLVLDIIFGQW
jgi:hypothetical protein